MLAAFYTQTGLAKDVLAIGEITTPDPGPGEVRVRIAASGINPADVKRRAGEPGRSKLFPLIIPHSDGYGHIDAVGPDVTKHREGDAVWVWNAQWKRPHGTAAQYAILPAQQAVTLPSNLMVPQRHLCAALGVPALTAHRSVSALSDVAGRTVLVHGGGGMVGQFAIQFLKRRGAYVMATARDAVSATAATEAGCDLILPAFVEDGTAQALHGAGIDTVDSVIDVNFGANCGQYCDYVRTHGEVVVVGSVTDMFPAVPVLAFQVHGLTVRFISGSEQPETHRAQAIDEITSGLSDGWLRGRIQSVHTLSSIVAAHEEVERGGLSGKVVVQVDA